MSETVQKPTEVFYLQGLAPLLADFKLPQGAFEPNGAWTQRYQVCGLAGRVWPGGSLTLTRSTLASEAVQLALDYRHQMDLLGEYQARARLECQTGPLAIPTRWEASARTVRAGQTVPGTDWTQTAEMRGDGLELVVPKGRKVLPVGRDWTLNWALFDVVQRLPLPLAAPLRFDLVKDFDEHRPGQVLAFRETLTVALAGAPTRLHAFSQTGQGVLPTIYYRDDAGRLLFAVSGLEGYILDTAAAAA